MDWKCYIIYNKNCSYVGATNNTDRRIRKHNQEIVGGAKYTRKVGKGWKYICIIEGFKNKIDCLRFEWAVKHYPPKNKTGIYNRIIKLEQTLNKERWTSKSTLSKNYNLKINWFTPDFIIEEFNVPDYIQHNIKF